MNRLLLLLLALPLLGCPPPVSDDDDDDSAVADDDDDATPVAFAVWSPDFVEPYFDNPHDDCDQALPIENSCGNPNPEIRWEGAPEGTVAFVLIYDDPTFQNYEHWAIYNIPGTATGLDAAISGYGINNNPPGDAVELDNGSGFNGYLGSCPGPNAVNRYRWRLWALSEEISTPVANYAQLAGAADGVALDMVEMCHVFDGANSDI